MALQFETGIRSTLPHAAKKSAASTSSALNSIADCPVGIIPPDIFAAECDTEFESSITNPVMSTEVAPEL